MYTKSNDNNKGDETNKAPGIEKISVTIVKNITEEISRPLSHLINEMFEAGICPLEFKMLLVKPIHKSGDKCVLLNYDQSFLSLVTQTFLRKHLKQG